MSRRYSPSQQAFFEMELIRALAISPIPQSIKLLQTRRAGLMNLSYQKMGQMLNRFKQRGWVRDYSARPKTYELTKGARNIMNEGMFGAGLPYDMAVFDLLNGGTIASSPEYQNEVADAVAYAGSFRGEEMMSDADF